MSKLVKLPSLVAKYCKTWKIYACKICKFCTLLYYAYHKMAELSAKDSVQKGNGPLMLEKENIRERKKLLKCVTNLQIPFPNSSLNPRISYLLTN